MKPLACLFALLGPVVLAFACGNPRLLFATGSGGAGGSPGTSAGGGMAAGPTSTTGTPGSVSSVNSGAMGSTGSSGSSNTTGSSNSSGSGGLDAGYDGPPYMGPCGPWTDDAVCHLGPPPFIKNCNLASECIPFAHCQQVSCVQSTCCFSVTNGAPATCGPANCITSGDCAPDGGGAPSACAALSCVNGQCVSTFTGSCCSP